jgi:hypothetical protein
MGSRRVRTKNYNQMRLREQVNASENYCSA